jgi:glycosyltransferase involved in cell wall biosynthesis
MPVGRSRVALLITELHPGGAERVVYELATRLDARFDPFVIALWSPDGIDGRVATALRLAGIPVHLLRVRAKLDLPRLVPLVRLLRAERPAILHAHLFHANLVARLVAPLVGGLPVITTHHAVQPGRHSPRLLADRVTTRLDTRTVAVSQAAAEFARDVVGVRPEAVRMIPNGIDLERAHESYDVVEARRDLDLPPDRPVVGTVGRLDREKGHADLLHSWRHVLAGHPGATLAIAGDGSERSSLVSLAARLGISPSVRLVGHCRQVPRFLAALDVFAMPSRAESFGLALVEALAAGLPCVASAVGGLPEVMGGAGVLVPPRAPALLGAAISGVLADPARRTSLGTAARARAQLFPVEKMIAGYEALYDEVLGAPR